MCGSGRGSVWRKEIEVVVFVSVPRLQQLTEDEYDDVQPVELLSKSTRALSLPPPKPPFKPGSKMEEELYDDIDGIPDDFPDPPPELSLQNDSRPPVIRNEMNKKKEENEKDFRKKFKYVGDIKIIGDVMVDPNSSLTKGSGRYLSLTPGEILEVIEYSDLKKALCRNEDGKYGFAPRSLLLHNIYDDIDSTEGTYCKKEWPGEESTFHQSK
uniref:FYN-binding protein 1-like n=1 Tax=Pristiophorus japonicus TaxID=55135 RepID=UPI00398EEA63